ncbi:unnamed protein product [Darwinula stevensoni]|uniref:Zinc transporter ZIP14 n=1 Tax=Darwinula stevensoni TaxID=69355 RepID=A0A7R9A0L5_9CRUS|nr:unnamed protein product [Darwinula stevensoni]CAG0885802.1 unnamed protein product [Darwinula stevensoni]
MDEFRENAFSKGASQTNLVASGSGGWPRRYETRTFGEAPTKKLRQETDETQHHGFYRKNPREKALANEQVRKEVSGVSEMSAAVVSKPKPLKVEKAHFMMPALARIFAMAAKTCARGTSIGLLLSLTLFFKMPASCSGKEPLLNDAWNPKWGPLPDDPADIMNLLMRRFSYEKPDLSIESFGLLYEVLHQKSGISLDTLPPLDGPFDLLRNCTVNSKASSLYCNVASKCLSSRELVELYLGGQYFAHPSQNHDLHVSDIHTLCPPLLFQAASGICSLSLPNVKHEEQNSPSKKEVWGYGLLCVTVISLCSLFGAGLLPCMGKNFFENMLTVLIGLAVGSLTGSSLFHLIPQASSMPFVSHKEKVQGFTLAKYHENHEYLYISLMITFGIYLFFLVERILKILLDHRKRMNRKQKHSTTDVQMKDSSEGSSENQVAEGQNISSIPHDPSLENGLNEICLVPNSKDMYESSEQVIKASFGHQKRPKPVHGHNHEMMVTEGDKTIATVAWMVIFGDGLHNLIDGLSIGASFNNNILTGVSVSIAVLCEEFPHELGDLAVLLHAGMSLKQALLYNFLSACVCYIGLVIGIFLGNVDAAGVYIFGLAGGMFLYIALVDMVPEMNEKASEASKKGLAAAAKVLLLQCSGFVLGTLVLFCLAYFQESFSFN